MVPKHRKTAVARNRLKRRLREIGRTQLLPALHGTGLHMDVLVRARPEAYTATFGDLRQELRAIVDEVCSRGS